MVKRMEDGTKTLSVAGWPTFGSAGLELCAHLLPFPLLHLIENATMKKNEHSPPQEKRPQLRAEVRYYIAQPETASATYSTLTRQPPIVKEKPQGIVCWAVPHHYKLTKICTSAQRDMQPKYTSVAPPGETAEDRWLASRAFYLRELQLLIASGETDSPHSLLVEMDLAHAAGLRP